MAATASSSEQQPILNPKRRRSRPSPLSPSHFTMPSPTHNFFNSALTAGLLNPNSPPPRSSPSLFEMMANDPDSTQIPPSNAIVLPPNSPIPPQETMHQRLSELLTNRSPGNEFNDPRSSDLNLNLSSKDGFCVSMNVHTQILIAHSRFFAGKLRNSSPRAIEIDDCDDIEVYVLTLRSMYCNDLRKMLMKEGVTKVIQILQVSAEIEFDAGVYSCLEYLEAAPWTELEEQNIASLLSKLRLESAGASEVLKRLSIDVTAGIESPFDNDKVLINLLHVVLEGKDEKARREMKGLVSKMLKEDSSKNDLRKGSLYSATDRSLQLLSCHLLQAAAGNTQDSAQISRQADNLHWLLDILIDRQISEDFLMTWASKVELSGAHPKVPAVHRYEVSRVTARFFVGIGKGQLMASKEARCLLLKTWLIPFYDDFGWLMRGSSKGFDRHVVEDGLSHTILTLSLNNQREIMVSWFDRFLNCGDDCPNLQRGFEVWWRRAFGGRNEDEELRRIRIVN